MGPHCAPGRAVDRSAGISPGLGCWRRIRSGGATLLGRLVTGWLLDGYFAPRVAVVLPSVAALGTHLLAIAPSGAVGHLAAALYRLLNGWRSRRHTVLIEQVLIDL